VERVDSAVRRRFDRFVATGEFTCRAGWRSCSSTTTVPFRATRCSPA